MADKTSWTARAMLALGTLGASVMLGGCVFGHQTGGNGRSNDMFTYESTPYIPVSIDLVDTRTDEVFWSMDVPVGQKLVFRFYKDKAEMASSTTPDLMRWELYDAKKSSSPLRNAISAPPSQVRRIDVSLRETPEYPPENDDIVGVAIVPDRPTQYDINTPDDDGRSGTYYADRWNKSREAYRAKSQQSGRADADAPRSGTYTTND